MDLSKVGLKERYQRLIGLSMIGRISQVQAIHGILALLVTDFVGETEADGPFPLGRDADSGANVVADGVARVDLNFVVVLRVRKERE
jgi:hypothetical protein